MKYIKLAAEAHYQAVKEHENRELRHYLRRSCCQWPGGGRGDTDSALLPLCPSGNQTGIAGRNMQPLLEDRQGNPGLGSVRGMSYWITTEGTHTHTHPGIPSHTAYD